MDLQPIEDPNLDCPAYDRGPVIELPPDLTVGAAYAHPYDSMPSAWHQYTWIQENIWPIATGKGVRVAVLDTGYNKHRFGPEPIAARSFIRGESWADGNAHGTHVAGTVLCRRDDAGKSLGLAPDADLIVGKVLSNRGSGSSQGIAEGIRWAADEGAHLINMSLGGGSSYGPTNDAIDYAWSKGCAVFASAGNSGYNGSNTIGWPAKYQNCVCVGAYRQGGQIANFSSGGREIDWACPGQEILSFSTNGSGWRSMSGTSMSCPWGVGLFACLTELWLRQGRAMFSSAQDVRDYFTKALTDAGRPGFDERFGIGVPRGDVLVAAILRELVGT
jgi:subtilisin family serine protease